MHFSRVLLARRTVLQRSRSPPSAAVKRHKAAKRTVEQLTTATGWAARARTAVDRIFYLIKHGPKRTAAEWVKQDSWNFPDKSCEKLLRNIDVKIDNLNRKIDLISPAPLKGSAIKPPQPDSSTKSSEPDGTDDTTGVVASTEAVDLTTTPAPDAAGLEILKDHLEDVPPG